MSQQHFIFDFDGTLVDSFAKVIDKFNILADEFHFRKISQAESIKLRDLNSKELLQYLQIPIYKMPSILYKARKTIKNEIPMLMPFKNIPQVLQQLHSANFSLSILTSNSEENVINWLEIHNMDNLFSFIHTESNFFGKNRVLKKMLRKHGIEKEQTFYVGDETRDIDAAKENDIYSIAVTWGFNSEKILTQHQPDYIATKPEDFLVIGGLQGIARKNVK